MLFRSPVDTTSPWPGSSDGKIPWTYAHFADPYIALAQASGATSKIKLATGITLIPERNPLVLAKAVSTLDLFSEGRFMLGIGTGWLKEETEIMGGDFPHRWTQAKESLLALKELWTKEESEFHGKYYDFPPVYCYPKPISKPHPPILLGSMIDKVFGRIINYANGWIPIGVQPDVVQKGRETLDKMATENNVDPNKFDITVLGVKPDKKLLSQFEKAGANRVTISLKTDTKANSVKQLNQIASEVL